MDSYLDPSLAGALAFLDASPGLHQGADPAGMASSTPLLAAFDYDQWINPQATMAFHAQPGLPVSHHPGQQAGLGPRDQLAHPHQPFGALHSEPVGSTTRLAAGSTLRDANGHANDALSLIYGSGDFVHELFAPSQSLSTSTTAHGRVANAAQLPSYPSQPTLSVGERRHDLIVPDVSSYSIAAYGEGSSGSPIAQRPTTASGLPVASPRVQHTPGRISSAKNSPAVVRSIGTSSGTRTPKTPQADESVPEAALHLLRLAQPDGSTTGSVATASTGGREDEASCDEDAEGESDDTSIHSIDAHAKKPLAPDVVHQGHIETRVWLHDPAQPPLHVQRGSGPDSRRPSASDSVTSTRTGRPVLTAAGTQREASVASIRSRAASDAASTASAAQQNAAPVPPSPAVRRTSSRVRKPRVSDVAADASSDLEDDEQEYKPGHGDADATEYSDGAEGGTSSKKKGKAVAGKGKTPAKRSSTSTGQGASLTKKARLAKGVPVGGQPRGPRKPRRQAFIPPNLQSRTFPPHVEISDMFPRFYRSFPISSAFAPDSFVLKAPKPPVAPSGPSPSTASSSAGHYLPSTLGIYDDSAFAAAQFYSGAHTPIPSTSSLVDANHHFATVSYLPMASPSAYSPHTAAVHHPHQNPHQPPPQHGQPHLAMSPALSATSSVAATPFSSQASVSTPPSTVVSTSSTPAAAATPTTLGPNGITVMLPPPDAKWNKGGEPLNLYWPRFVKGNADDKCGLCPICAEPKERGGEGELKWLKLKNSSYVYHMSYTHGLSNLTGLPFSPPVEMRTVDLPPSTKDQRAQMVEGRCHKCNDWIKLLSVKNIDAIVPELIWWKHAKKCHAQTQIAGEGDPFQHDEVYALVLQRKAEHGIEA